MRKQKSGIIVHVSSGAGIQELVFLDIQEAQPMLVLNLQ
jgi:hypothetical protein